MIFMPSITLDKKIFIERLGKEVSDEVLSDRIPMIGTDLEGIDREEISVEIFPNRPDMLSEEGLARAMRYFMGLDKGLKEYKVNKSDYKARIDPSVKDVREYAAVAVVKGLDIDEGFVKRLMQIQEKLHTTHSRNRKSAAIGVHDLAAVRFPITYTTRGDELSFIPLDCDMEMDVKQILSNHDKGKAYAHLVQDGRYPVWLDACGKVISFPPIINGAHTTVSSSTKDLLIDITGTDENVVVQALNIIVTALAEAGGKIYSVDVEGGSYPDLSSGRMDVQIDYINRLLGLELSAEQISEHLSRMGYGSEKISDNTMTVYVPCYRTDILHPIDIAEDVAIAYGYENFESEISDASTIGGEASSSVFISRLSELLCGFGLMECKSYHLTNCRSLFERMEKQVPKEVVKTKNAVNIEFDTLRTSILPGLMKIFSENTHNEYPQDIFEIGSVVRPDKNEETNVDERTNLSAALCGRDANFSQIKAVAESIASNLGIDLVFREHDDSSYIDGRCASIWLGDVMIGELGEIHPQVLNNWSLEMPLAAIELNISAIMERIL